MLLLIASSSCFLLGQQSSSADVRWRLIGDNAIIPVRDLITIAAHRVYLEDRAVSFKVEAIERGKEGLALRQVIGKKNDEVRLLNEQLTLLRGQVSIMDEMVASCGERESKLRPWATIGKVGTITASLAILGIVAERVINSANP
jgi:hypothetical protein